MVSSFQVPVHVPVALVKVDRSRPHLEAVCFFAPLIPSVAQVSVVVRANVAALLAARTLSVCALAPEAN